MVVPQTEPAKMMRHQLKLLATEVKRLKSFLPLLVPFGISIRVDRDQDDDVFLQDDLVDDEEL